MNQEPSKTQSTQANDPFDVVQKAENLIIRERRKIDNGGNNEEPLNDLTGLGLSGGGIRSATFNLGLLQALEKHEKIEGIDYMSTVSGGGYIGSCLTWFSHLGKGFPFGKEREDHNKILGGLTLNWLRAHGNYLTPGEQLSTWALVAALLGGIIVNLFVLIPLFMAAVFLLSICVPSPICEAVELRSFFGDYINNCNTFILFLLFGILLLLIFVIVALVTAFLTRFSVFRKSKIQYRINKAKGAIIAVGILLIAIGTIPLVHAAIIKHISHMAEAIMSSISLSGVIGVLGSLFKRKGGNEAKGLRSVIMSVGLGLAIYGLFLWIFHLVSPPSFLVLLVSVKWYYWVIGVGFWLIVALFANINHVSMHRFYRNRLMDAYMPHGLIDEVKKYGTIAQKKDAEDAPENVHEAAENCLISEIKSGFAPYHIINTNLQTIDSKVSKLRQRCGENFIFSKCYSGSENTAWIKTDEYLDGNMNLATAMAISGAAVDANTSATRSRPLSFIMSLFNARLGYWTTNPRLYSNNTVCNKMVSKSSNLGFYFHMFADLLGWGLHEKSNNIHLSDGGHFENLGLYELIRRRCNTIIISDAGADPERDFEDLAKAIEMIRVDFGVEIRGLDTDKMRKDEKSGLSTSAWAEGTIKYAKRHKNDVPQEGTIYYIKPSMLDGLSQDIKSYHSAHPDFPHQSTADQFFDEKQFEAYRELGFTIGNSFSE